MPNIFERYAAKQNTDRNTTPVQPAQSSNVFAQYAAKHGIAPAPQQMPMAQPVAQTPIQQTQQMAPAPAHMVPVEPPRTPAAKQPYTGKRGVYAGFKRGLQSGSTGLMLGQHAAARPEDEGFFEHIASMGGELLADIPLMTAGSVLGAIGGSAVGPVGAITGASVGAFSLPTAWKESVAEYRDYTAKGGSGTFGEFLERAGRIGKETGKSALLGGAVGQVSKFLPYLEKVPGMTKLLDMKYGPSLVKGGLELGTLTAGQAALERRMPTVREAVDNGLLLFAANSAHRAGVHAVGSYGETASKVMNKIPGAKSLIEMVSKLPGVDFMSKLNQTANQKMYFDMLEAHVGKRRAKVVESQFKWREALAEAEKSGGKFTPEQLEEMIYYRQKTGNPFIKGDTYEKLAERVPEHAKKFVDEVVHQHLEEWLKAWNEHPETKDINPREALEEIYLPGLYEYDPKLYARVIKGLGRKFKGKNPLLNAKTFLTYNDALIKGGLKPKYRNMVELMQAYDKIMIKSMGNAELISEIKKMENKSGKKIIVNSNNKKAYKEASLNGYVPFQDPYLRRYVAGTEKEGKPIMATTAAPSLVHPDFAAAFQGVFAKDAYKAENEAWKAYDALSHTLKVAHVALSPFHYFALAKHGASTIGFKDSFKYMFKRWSGEVDALLNDKDFMVDAAKSGLTLHHEVEAAKPEKSFVEKKVGETVEKVSEAYKGSPVEAVVDKIMEYIPEKVKDYPLAEKGMGLIKKTVNHLFGEYRPRLKAATWKNFVDAEIGKRVKEGQPPTQEKIAEIKRDMAQVVNNTYGGQLWEIQPYFNDPAVMKKMRRLVGYPDWTTSSIRNVATAFEPGTKGAVTRKAWLQYGINFALIQGFLKFINSGWVQTDPDKKPSGLRFDVNKAFKALNVFKGDPDAFWKAPLPDFDVKIAGAIFNPGRDAKGKKLYTHPAKQAMEIKHYFDDFLGAVLSKSNPLIQAAYKQLHGSTPYGDKDSKVQGEWKYGEQRPWGGTEQWTPGRLAARTKELAKEFMPYSLSGIERTGIGPYVSSGFGGLPTSQGMTIDKAIPRLEKAFRSKNATEVNKIEKILKEAGIKDQTIKKTVSMVRNAIAKEK